MRSTPAPRCGWPTWRTPTRHTGPTSSQASRICTRRSADDLAPAIERRYRVLGEDNSWCLLTTEFQLYTMRGGMMADQFGDIYESYRQRIGELLATHFERLGIASRLTLYVI